MSELRFVVYGSIVTTNRRLAPDAQGQLRKTKEARASAHRVSEIAGVCAGVQGWVIPEAASVEIVAFCSKLDVDNSVKGIQDALKGIAWRDDADVLSLHVERWWDNLGERYEVTVRAIDDRRPGRAPRAKKRPVYDGGPIPDGFALLGSQLIPVAEAMKMVAKR